MVVPESCGFWPQAGNRRFPALTKDASRLSNHDTLKLVTAEDADGNGGAAAEEYSGSVTLETDDDGTPTPDDSTPDGSTPDDSTTPDTPDDKTGSPTGGDGSGFGPTVALSAVLGGALLLYRRR